MSVDDLFKDAKLGQSERELDAIVKFLIEWLRSHRDLKRYYTKVLIDLTEGQVEFVDRRQEQRLVFVSFGTLGSVVKELNKKRKRALKDFRLKHKSCSFRNASNYLWRRKLGFASRTLSDEWLKKMVKNGETSPFPK